MASHSLPYLATNATIPRAVINALKQRVFNKLKKRFTIENILIVFNPNKPIIIETNISDYIVRASIL